MEMDAAALTGFCCAFVERMCKTFLPFFFSLREAAGEFGVLLSLSVGQLLTSKIGRGDNASPSFGSRCHVIYWFIYLFSGSEAERFALLWLFFFPPLIVSPLVHHRVCHFFCVLQASPARFWLLITR